MIIGNVFYNNSDGNIYWRHGSSFIANNTIYCNTSHSISFDNVGNDTISFNNFISSNYSIYYGSDYGSPPDIYASNNFWGTMNKDSIAIQIWDIFDNYNLGIVIYEPFLNCPVKDAPGFLYQVEINPAPPIKCGLYTFNLIFSKPMDINVQPLVTFGIYYPYLQNIIEGGWIDSTLWQGTYEFNMMTGDGINYLNVTKSKDCNDIEIPEDMRFSFVVDVKGVGIIKDVLILDRFFLYQNYPNPFNPTTTISYQLPKSSFVKLAIYDINGRLIETLVNENRNSGYYTVGWTADKVCSGIYFYRIDAGEFTCVKKCLVVK